MTELDEAPGERDEIEGVGSVTSESFESRPGGIVILDAMQGGGDLDLLAVVIRFSSALASNSRTTTVCSMSTARPAQSRRGWGPLALLERVA